MSPAKALSSRQRSPIRERTHAVSTPVLMQCISRPHAKALFKTQSRPRAHRIDLGELNMQIVQRGDPMGPCMEPNPVHKTLFKPTAAVPSRQRFCRYL